MILDVTMGHKGMQKEVESLFGVNGDIINLDIRERMGNGMVPDIVADSVKLPFKDGVADVILFDPPFSFHNSISLGSTEYRRFYITYGLDLYKTRNELGTYIEKTFNEIHRVLKDTGYCILKWSESRIRLSFPLELKGRLMIDRKIKRPSKHWGTKTGTSTWYVFLVKA